MARAYEITGWLDGRKLRREGWHDGGYIKLENNEWSRINFNHHCFHESELFYYDDWIELTEPKKITLFRYTYNSDNKIFQSPWMTCELKHWTFGSVIILKTELKEVEIEEK